MSATEARPVSRRLIFSIRRLVHSVAYFLASLAALALFVLVLMLAESLVYALTDVPVSVWAMVIAAVAVAFGFGPVLHALQGWLDRLFFRRHLDTLAAIRQLGAGDLAKLPVRDVEPALLERICRVSHRRFAALDERARAGGRLVRWPEDAPEAPEAYEMRLELPRGGGEAAWLWLGPRTDGWPADDDERASLQSLARFAAMSLEHARLTHQVAEAARLDSLSRVVRQLHSHDLKNRLHDLRFLAHHLDSGKLDAADMARLVEAIGKVTGRMQTLMQRLTDPRAPLDPAIAPLDLAGLLERMLRERLWPEGIEVRRETVPLPPAAGDAELLRGVFDNLFDNAVQAMQGKGRLTIAARPVDDGRAIEVRVTDTGCGMDRAFLETRIFRLFSSSRPNGLGVGLYLTRRIVLAHGGEIRAESPGPGRGASFIVRLPAWTNDTTRPAGDS